MKHQFVETIPEDIEDSILYISLEYNVTKHLCPCGCGDEIVASLSPARYQLSYDGETVSMTPSFGNWSHECGSHYCIIEDKIVWANSMSRQRRESVIEKDKVDLKKQVDSQKSWIDKIKSFIRH